MNEKDQITSISPEVENAKKEKQLITVPAHVRYISDWAMEEDGYNLEYYPFPHIMNKVLTGCGFTEYCLRNNQNLILCSPRKMLLENKEDQHIESNVYYARNEVDENMVEYERTITVSDTRRAIRNLRNSLSAFYEATGPTQEEIDHKNRLVMDYKDRIRDHVQMCFANNIPCKILVTYDSFRHVKEVLVKEKKLDQFQIVVDEFQSILVDCKFKSDTELELLYLLKDLKKVCFVSATPMMDKYLAVLEEFKDLPYYEFDWATLNPERVISPTINVHKSERINQEIIKVIYSYKDGKFERDSHINPVTGQIEEVISDQAVLYVNSVTLICSMIVKCELFPEQCNILCARTSENEEKVRKAFNQNYRKFGKKFRFKKGDKVIGTIPKYGDPHKMLTFCTRTVYLGADFYSPCARSFVFCDSNIDCLSVDISMDLPQILGRQRLTENPWKNTADLFVKSTIYNLPKEVFERRLAQKIDSTNNLLSAYGKTDEAEGKSLSEKFLKDTVGTCYRDDYVAVNRHMGAKMTPVFNQLMLVSEIRAFDIQQVDYKDRFSIYNTLRDKGFSTENVDDELSAFESLGYYHHKMKYVCEKAKTMSENRFNLFLNSIPKSFKNYYLVLGPDKCRALMYQKGNMEREYQRQLNNQGISLDDRVYATFHAGDRELKSVIKAKLAKIYKDSGYDATAKASDIDNWFKTKPIQITNRETKKRENGFELLKRLKK